MTERARGCQTLLAIRNHTLACNPKCQPVGCCCRVAGAMHVFPETASWENCSLNTRLTSSSEGFCFMRCVPSAALGKSLRPWQHGMTILSTSQHAALMHSLAALLPGTFRMLRRSSQHGSVQGFVEHLHCCPPLISVHWCMSVPCCSSDFEGG